VLYGVTLFLGALALRQLLEEGLTGVGIATILLSLALTVLLVLVDIRARVRY
jgi:hypothetical protein